MNCEEISELLPAYALGALEPEEMEAVDAHLRTCDLHEAELVDLRATVFALDRHGAGASPSTSLAHRIRRVAEGAPVEQPTRIRRPWFTRGFLRAAAAAAVLLLVFTAGLFAGPLLLGEDGETLAYSIQNENGALMEVHGSTSDETVTVIMAGLERLEDRSYQVWAIRDGRWLSMGVCNTDEQGEWVGDFSFQLEGNEQVALTIEPRGGSDGGPTGETVLRTTH